MQLQLELLRTLNKLLLKWYVKHTYVFDKEGER